MKGCDVGITVKSNTFVEYGRLAIVKTDSATSLGEMNPSVAHLSAITLGDNKLDSTFPG